MYVTNGDWSSSTTTDHYHKTITANAKNTKTGEKSWIDGKVWKYRTWDDLDKIRNFIDKLKLKLGVIKHYEG